MFRRRRPRVSFRPALESLESRVTPTASLLAHLTDIVCPAIKADTSVVSSGSNELLAAAVKGGKTKQPYSYWAQGNGADRDVNPTSGGLALAGGGTDVDRVFTWMGEKANGGDFVVIRASGTDAYNKYIRDLVPSLDSVATLLIPSIEAANDPFVAATIRNAEAVFIAGGDQANYENFWAGTELEEALYDALQRHVPLGGTSAGLAILGEIDFTATVDTITTVEALADPYDPRVTLDGDLLTPEDAGAAGTPLQYLQDTITDSHFRSRDRMGRLITFLGRMDADNAVPGAPRGIGINEQTALLIEENGLASVVGNPYSRKLPVTEQLRSVYLLTGTASPPIVTLDGPELTYAVDVQRADYIPGSGGDTIDLNDWLVIGGSSYSITVTNGVLDSSIDLIYG